MPEGIENLGDGWLSVRLGKKLAGRDLSGREHNEFPSSPVIGVMNGLPVVKGA